MTLGMAYLAFYVANSPAVAGVSGVIAVVVMGIYGSATGKWDMSPRVAESGHFFRCGVAQDVANAIPGRNFVVQRVCRSLALAPKGLHVRCTKTLSTTDDEL